MNEYIVRRGLDIAQERGLSARERVPWPASVRGYRLRATSWLPGYAARLTDDHTLDVDVARGQGLNDIFARLTAAGIEVASMRNKVNRLEELASVRRLMDMLRGSGGQMRGERAA